MAKRKIYYLQSCDEWRSNDSMRLLFIGTSVTKLKMKIFKEIREGNMVYDDDTLPRRMQADRFLKDFNASNGETQLEINCKLGYGRYDCCEDNEELN